MSKSRTIVRDIKNGATASHPVSPAHNDLNITTLVFDLGGVLIELGDLSEMMASSPQSADEVWAAWITSPSVRRFESGNCLPEEFAQNMIREFKLSMTISDFLVHFNAWPKGLMPGAIELLEDLSAAYRIACLSNTNAAHYNSFLKHQAIMPHFEAAFLSHKMGCLKPDTQAFQRAINGLGVLPSEIVYFDDHPKNVQAAKNEGMNAALANSPADIRDTLISLNLLPMSRPAD